VVVLSQYANPSYALALLDTGSAGRAYVLKERVHDLDQLVSAIRAVSEGGSLIEPKVAEGLVADRARAAKSPLSQLTTREKDVLRKMAEGMNNASIAEGLVVTERSVEKGDQFDLHEAGIEVGASGSQARQGGHPVPCRERSRSSRQRQPAVKTPNAVRPVIDADAAIERLDPVA
jgi:hypothetical protein